MSMRENPFLIQWDRLRYFPRGRWVLSMKSWNLGLSFQNENKILPCSRIGSSKHFDKVICKELHYWILIFIGIIIISWTPVQRCDIIGLMTYIHRCLSPQQRHYLWLSHKNLLFIKFQFFQYFSIVTNAYQIERWTIKSPTLITILDIRPQTTIHQK